LVVVVAQNNDVLRKEHGIPVRNEFFNRFLVQINGVTEFFHQPTRGLIRCLNNRLIVIGSHKIYIFRAMSDALVPPKANEFDITACKSTERRATKGTKSKSQATSGLSR
jgi:mannose-6-phosphate isomerase class I